MSGREKEVFLARLYTDEAARARFLADPEGFGRACGLSADEVAQLRGVDLDALSLAGRGFDLKRARKAAHARSRLL